MTQTTMDKIIEETTIAFPRDIGRSEARVLMRYLAINVRGDVNYKMDYFMNVSNFPNGPTGFKEDLGTVSLSSTIMRSNPSAFDSFQLQNSANNSSRLSSLEFYRVPGWDLQEYRQEVQDLWKETRDIVAAYFQQGPGKRK